MLTLLALVLAFSASACSGESASADEALEAQKASKDEEGEESEEPSLPVEVEPLARGKIEETLNFNANLEAEKSATVFARTLGLVMERSVEEGSRVREGQLLLRLENDEQKSAVASARVELERARREYQRQKRLFEQQLISDQAFNDATFEIERLEIRLADAERALSHTEIRAPISGTVTRRMVEVGQQVAVNEALFEIIDFDSLVARVFVPEKELTKLEVGLEARVSAAALSDTVYEARIDRVAPTIDARSGTVRVTVGVGGQPGLRPGLYVDVSLVTATRDDALLVPRRALVYDGERSYVFRVDEELRAERVLVEPSLADELHVVPLSGLAEGDRLVVAGQSGLKQGTLLEVQRREGVIEQAGEEELAKESDRSSLMARRGASS